MTRIRTPPAVRWIARTLEEAGFETWAVGGAVRDALYGHPSQDWDLTTRATPGEIRRIFRRTVPIGVDHGTVGVLSREGVMYEVTTFRKDIETTGRHAVVEFAKTIDEDLARRDFTINAVAWHPLHERLHDPFGGADDMDRRLLRTVGDPSERFSEDYLRVLRALRFAGAFRLRIDRESWRALVDAVPRMGILSPERVREELEKTLTGTAPPSQALALYSASGALGFLYPELERLVGLAREEGEGDEWSHALRVVDLLSPERPPLRWAALLQAVGRPSEGPGEDRGERERGVLRSLHLTERLRSSKARSREVGELVEWIRTPPADETDEAGVRRWMARVGRERLSSLLRIWAAATRADELRGGGGWSEARFLGLARRLRAVARSGSPLTVDELDFSGRELIGMGYRPGRYFGDLLDFLLARVLEDPGMNDRERLAPLALRWLEEREIEPGGPGR